MTQDRSRTGSRRRLHTLAIAIALLVVAGGDATASARPTFVRLTGSVPAWATERALARHDDPSKRIHFAVVLGWRDANAVRRLAESVSDPASPDYGRYLSPAGFRTRFSPTSEDVALVLVWLRSQRLRPGRTPISRLLVPASGTVAQVERAFHVRVNLYRVDGHLRRSPDSDPSVPSSLADIIQSVVGLDASRKSPASSDPYPPPLAFLPGRPCSAYWGQKVPTSFPPAYGAQRPLTVCGYSPEQLQGAYGLNDVYASGIDATGVTVAVVDAYASPRIERDLATYSQRHGLPAPSLTQFVAEPKVPKKHPGLPRGWAVEETIDLEAVHAIAPGAALVYAGARTSYSVDLDIALLDVIDNARASIVSNSYGLAGEQVPPHLIKVEEQIYEEAAAQGIGLYFSSGDCGDERDPDGACGGAGYRTVDWSASSPFVTAVGGTTLGVGPSNDYLFEAGWGNSYSSLGSHGWKPTPPGAFTSGSGGGTSVIFDEPAYQSAVVPADLADFWTTGPHRVVPDVTIDGTPSTGMLVGQMQTFPNGSRRYAESRWGGTSLASPLFAGVMALAEQPPAIHSDSRTRSCIRLPERTRSAT